ncbi:10741_t:CDS:2 [Funneliformis geosporum]|uniref:2551_t:CDS:1 n=1 Tax=Funneliformis geosporum TaxID=1117311 RepID=A0A9W4SJV3_9GLOM|nr:2551_t:CDS:2 [Funneliformis geosporum]CAI2172011.1 10741_t:CDS:2 [Funneliformis geosporum]
MTTDKLIFPPYVEDLEPRNFMEEDWVEAINVWNTNLSLLLRFQDTMFQKQILQNNSLHKFLETFLGTHARSRDVKYDEFSNKELEKKVLNVLLRASESKVSSSKSRNSTSLMGEIYRKNWISVPFLLDLVATYGKSNFTCTKKILDNIMDSVPELTKDFELHSITLYNFIKAIQDKFKELNEKVRMSENVNCDSIISDAKIYLSYILDLSITLDCLFTVSKSIAYIFSKNGYSDEEDFLMTINIFYDDIIPLILDIFISQEIYRDFNILKHALISLAYHTLDACYFSPLGFTSSEEDIFMFTKSDEKLGDLNETLNRMISGFMFMINYSPLEKPVQYLIDAPLLLDVEIEFDLIGKLTKIKNEIYAEIDYIIMSLESMQNMNQETDKAPWRMRLDQKQKRHMSPVSNGFNGRKTKIVDSTIKSNGINEDEMHLISQVQEVFPDLGEGFIEKCLTAFDNNVETVIDRLLSMKLPEHLASLDRNMALQEAVEYKNGDDLLSQRKNIFDNDEFDAFSGKNLDVSRMHKGKMNRGTVDKLLDDKSFVETHKESIIDIDPGIMYEEELIKRFQSDPSVFDRTSVVRKSGKRAQLRRITQMTDEQIEGWYIMFQRNWKGNREEPFNDSGEISSSTSHQHENQNRGRHNMGRGGYKQIRGGRDNRGRGWTRGNRGKGGAREHFVDTNDTNDANSASGAKDVKDANGVNDSNRINDAKGADGDSVASGAFSTHGQRFHGKKHVNHDRKNARQKKMDRGFH